MKNKGLLTLLGFILVIIGFLALVLSIVGVKFSFLLWIDRPGPLFGFLVRILMIITGFVLVYLAQTNYRGE
jgi:membrane protein insertase Oxa1/YidC/SpoIIIJ